MAAQMALNGMIYEKQLKLTPATKQNYGQGEIFNYVQTDTEKIMAFSWHSVEIFTFPVIVIYCVIFLFKLLKWSFISGLLVFLLGGILGTFFSSKIQKLDLEKKKLIDKRLNHTTESLNNIKTLKFYQWTDTFKKEVEKRRMTE